MRCTSKVVKFRAKVAFTKPLTTHLTCGKGNFSCRVKLTFALSESSWTGLKVDVSTCSYLFLLVLFLYICLKFSHLALLVPQYFYPMWPLNGYMFLSLVWIVILWIVNFAEISSNLPEVTASYEKEAYFHRNYKVYFRYS